MAPVGAWDPGPPVAEVAQIDRTVRPSPTSERLSGCRDSLALADLLVVDEERQGAGGRHRLALARERDAEDHLFRRRRVARRRSCGCSCRTKVCSSSFRILASLSRPMRTAG